MRRTFNFFFTIAALSLVLALLGGCLSSLGSYAEVPEDLRAFLEIESGLEVAFFDDDEVNWKTDSFFDSYAEIAVPSGVHTLRVVTRKEFSDEGTRGVTTIAYTLTEEVQADLLPRHRYRLREDSSFLDFFFGSYDLKLKFEDISR